MREYSRSYRRGVASKGQRMDRRRFLIGSAASALTAAPVFAQEAFPSHAITIINAFPPGGANDIVTRPLAAAMEPILKQPVVVETKAGAAGQVGAQFVAAAKPDGYTLLSHNTGISDDSRDQREYSRIEVVLQDRRRLRFRVKLTQAHREPGAAVAHRKPIPREDAARDQAPLAGPNPRL